VRAKHFWRAMFATTLTSGVLVAAAAQAAHAQTVVHTFTNVTCTASLPGQTLTRTQDVSIAIIAPTSVTAGQTFTLTFPGGTAQLPTTSSGVIISAYQNLAQVIHMNGATFDPGSPVVTPTAATIIPATNVAKLYNSAHLYAAGDYAFVNIGTVAAPVWQFYKSLVGGNAGHAPATSPTQWSVVTESEVTTWQSGTTYTMNQYTSFGGVVYKSITATNLGHQPDISPSLWQLAPTTTPETVTFPQANLMQYGTPGPFPTGNSSDAASMTLTTPDVSVSAVAPASGNITINMVSLTSSIMTTLGLVSVVCSIPSDTILTIPVQSGPANLSVDAGADVSANVGQAVTLHGSFTDPDTTPTLAWSVDSPFCSFTDTTIAAPDITCSHAGTFSATLSAHDGINADANDTALVTVTTPNQAPVVNAGPDVSGQAGNDIALNGSVTDPDSTPLIQWTVDNDTACTFDDDTAPHTTINCDTPGVYALTLTADDGVNAPVFDTATLTVNPAPPGLNANAGPDVSGNVNTAISLSGSVSDPGFTPTVHWTSDSPNCNFTNPTAAVTTITCSSSGVFAAILTAHDSTHPDATDVALVTVIAPNAPPVVNSGGNVTGKPNTSIALHGTVTDPDNTPTVHWTSDSPNCTFGNANLADTTINCTAIGVYAATLTGADGVNPPVMSTAVVTIVSSFPPVVNAGPDTSGLTGTAIALHGTVTDPDSSPTIQWVTGSPNCTFANPNAADTTITCTVGGVVAATLTANDGVNATVSDTALVTVTTPNVPPTVSAGPDLTEPVGHDALLNGTVTDPDSTPIVHWATGNPACTFGSPNTAVTTFNCSVSGIFAATLTASDGVNPPVSATALVTVVPGQCQKPCVSIGDVTVYEGASMAFPIVLSTAATGPITLVAKIIPGTATNCRATPTGCDYTTTVSGLRNISFKAGDRFKYLTITTSPDGTGSLANPEADRQFTVQLTGLNAGTTGVTPGKALGTGTIKDADALATTNQFLVGTSAIPEMDMCTGVPCKATAKISVSLPGPAKALSTVSVHYQTQNAGATTTNGNYTAKSGTLTFLAGGTAKKYISVTTLGNIVGNNPPYGIDITFTNPTPGWTETNNGHIDILDND
jgi:hypothetical protein